MTSPAQRKKTGAAWEDFSQAEREELGKLSKAKRQSYLEKLAKKEERHEHRKKQRVEREVARSQRLFLHFVSEGENGLVLSMAAFHTMGEAWGVMGPNLACPDQG